jgi:hypothetical protein
VIVLDVNINILVQKQHQVFLAAFLGCEMERTALGGDEVEVDGCLFKQLLNEIIVVQIHGELYGQPAVAGALVDVHFHLQQFIEDVGRLAEDSVVQSPPTFLAQLVDYKRLELLHFDQFFLVDVLRVVLEDIEEGLLVLALYVLEHLLALSVEVLPGVELLVCVFVLVIGLVDWRHLLLLSLVKAEDVIQVSLVDVEILVLRLRLLFL